MTNVGSFGMLDIATGGRAFATDTARSRRAMGHAKPWVQDLPQ